MPSSALLQKLASDTLPPVQFRTVRQYLRILLNIVLFQHD